MSNQPNIKSIKEELIARRRGEHKFGRSHEPWLNEESELLSALYYSGEDISAISITLDRSETAVFNRLRINKVMQEANRKRNHCNIGDKCKCSKCETRFDCTKNTEFLVKATQDFMLDYR